MLTRRSHRLQVALKAQPTQHLLRYSSDNFMRELFDAELKSAHTGQRRILSGGLCWRIVVGFVLKPIRNAKTELLGYLLTGSPANEHGIQLDALRLPAITVRGGVVAHCNELAKNLGHGGRCRSH